ncbi:MAG: four helix bundle protein [Aureliella sp.]
MDSAVRIIWFDDALPSSAVGKLMGRQLLRSGTSPAPNYAEARLAESKADFIHKLKIANRELNGNMRLAEYDLPFQVDGWTEG